MTRKSNIEIIGWIGVILIISAFALNIFGALNSDSVIYLFMNLLGSISIVVSSASKKDYQPVTLNAIWALIALIGIVRFLFN